MNIPGRIFQGHGLPSERHHPPTLKSGTPDKGYANTGYVRFASPSHPVAWLDLAEHDLQAFFTEVLPSAGNSIADGPKNVNAPR